MLESKCKKCGCKIQEGEELCPKCSKKKRKNILKSKNFWIVIEVIVVTAITISIILYKERKKQEKIEQERYDNLPIKVDISMTSYYGTIEYILYELGLDFDLVTMGANCYTGVQKNTFKTEKYGILHTDFRYCAGNKSQIFRVYNDESDQKLRNPKPGELPQFNEYGKKIKTTNNSL